ncbi:hypothetical protein EJ04DRAFT_549683 [Polyplosphaeria fusca]|uniref:Adhesin domain-containing protein n=1 Tax=Polyplosphaeria fusca TaxID=682080 RepID=A0A9P4R8R1_9PLEO|nr:hypothetical protein EJ04DRAFT_549683 [Polyplosphaeria fusca]
MFINTDAANKGRKPTQEHQEDVPLRSATRFSEEGTPLIGSFLGQGPPPSYLEATTPGPWNQTFAVPAGEEGARLLATSPGPHNDGAEGLYKGSRFRRKRLRENCTRRRLFIWIGALLLVIALAAIVAALLHKETREIKVSPLPIPADPAQSNAPQKEYPIRWPSKCGKDYNTATEEFDYASPSDFTVEEGLHQLDGPFRRVSGWIHVVQAPESQAPGTIRAKLAYAVSSSVDTSSIKYSYSSSGLTVGEPSIPDGFDGVRSGTACLGVSIVVYMSSGVELENFRVQSTHLGMQIHDGVDLSVTNSTWISLTTGTLDAPPFNSRETRLNTIAGSISGKYALQDILTITTKSGSVNVNVEPKEKAEDGPEAAIFEATSLSGSIRAEFERKHIPARDYQVKVDTKVGSVDGSFIHGSKTELTSVAGFLTADITPFRGGSYASTFYTSTTSGQTNINIKAPYVKTEGSMTKLESKHESKSGAIELAYPQEWEGHLQGKTLNGQLHLQGRDLNLIDEGTEIPGGSHVEATKGTGDSELEFGTLTGEIKVRVGKE